MEELLMCSVCIERYSERDRHPILLPRCGHSFCRSCVAMLISGGCIICPTCRTDQRVESADKLPTEYTLLAIIHAQENTKKETCERHSVKLSFWCRTCETATCGECLFEDHPTHSHDVIRASKYIADMKVNAQEVGVKFMEALDDREQSFYKVIFGGARRISMALRNVNVLRKDMEDARELMKGIRDEESIRAATSLSEATKFLGLKWNIQDANFNRKQKEAEAAALAAKAAALAAKEKEEQEKAKERLALEKEAEMEREIMKIIAAEEEEKRLKEKAREARRLLRKSRTLSSIETLASKEPEKDKKEDKPKIVLKSPLDKSKYNIFEDSKLTVELPEKKAVAEAKSLELPEKKAVAEVKSPELPEKEMAADGKSKELPEMEIPADGNSKELPEIKEEAEGKSVELQDKKEVEEDKTEEDKSKDNSPLAELKENAEPDSRGDKSPDLTAGKLKGKLPVKKPVKKPELEATPTLPVIPENEVPEEKQLIVPMEVAPTTADPPSKSEEKYVVSLEGKSEKDNKGDEEGEVKASSDEGPKNPDSKKDKNKDLEEDVEVEEKLIDCIQVPGFMICVEAPEGQLAGMEWGPQGLHVNCLQFSHVTYDIVIKSSVLNALIPSKNPIVFLELSADETILGKVYIKLWGHLKRAHNFLSLCLGDQGKSYLNTKFLQVYNVNSSGERILGGDYEFNNGRGGRGLYEDLEWNCDYAMPMKAGMITAAGSGQTSTNSLFLLCTQSDDSRNFSCPFGVVCEGLKVAKEAVQQTATKQVWISNCGVLIVPPKL